jgi:hypothetical protein
MVIMKLEILKKDVLYPLSDWHPLGCKDKSIMARWSGEKRPPKRGEWYLGGAKISAYQAPNDFNSAYAIAEIVRVKTIVKYVVEKL